MEFGVNGEIFIAYNNTIEVWDWIPSALELHELENSNPNYLYDDDSNDTLFLVASLFDIKGSILNITPINCDQLTNTYTILITSLLQSETIFTLKTFGQLFEEQESISNISLILPPCVHGLYPFTIKNSSRFIGIATNEGSLTIFDTVKNHPLSLSLDAAIIEDQVIFDISGRYLAYVPNQSPIDIEDQTLLIVPNSPKNADSIYSKFLNNLSITAIDGVTKLSDLNYSMISKNLHDISSNDLKTNLKNYLSCLINGFKQLNQFVIIYDLVEETKIGCFQPPNGCSNLSLSLFNSQLITINQRGDQLYNWDISRLPIEISLIDIQTRGKTSSIVDEIHWSSQNSIEIITRSSGSIHCFHNETNNWVLSNMKCLKLSNLQNGRGLIGYCQDDAIYLINPQNGSCSINFQLPKQPIPKSLLPNHIKLSSVDELIIRDDDQDQLAVDDTPLSQIEIETCLMTSPLYTNNKIQFGFYDFQKKFKDSNPFDDCFDGVGKECDKDDDDCTLFKQNYSSPGNYLNFKSINFGKGSGFPVFMNTNTMNEDESGSYNGGNDLIEAINDVLIVDEK